MTSSRNVLVSVAPADPPAPWIGGKRHLAQRICSILAATPHATYAEPFVGMGGVFLRRASRPGVEVINDVSGDVVTLFRVLQRFPEALFKELRWRPAMRAEFDRLKGARPQDLLDVERAARFLYLQTLSYAGKVQGRCFGADAVGPKVFDLARLEPRLRRIHDRLGGVIVEQLDWSDFIPRYSRPGTLFYLDPPYWGSESDYGTGVFGRPDFEQLSAMLAAADGMALLSLNDTREVREIFSWADLVEVETKYSIGQDGRANAVRELLIGKNLDLTPAAGQGRLL